MPKVANKLLDTKRVRHTSVRVPRFQRVLKAVEEMALEERETFVDVLKKRNAAARRAEIDAEIQESLEEFERGDVKHGSLEDLLKDLEA